MDKWIEAFTIFNKYSNDGNVAAEHDIIYAGPLASLVSAEDIARLEELGWFVDEDYESFAKYV